MPGRWRPLNPKRVGRKERLMSADSVALVLALLVILVLVIKIR
jgi:hypothetical protein